MKYWNEWKEEHKNWIKDRAFDAYWKIPASSPTAREGERIEASGYAVLDVLLKENPDVKIVAEDLGDMRPQVYELRDAYQLPGMKIIQFTFDPMEHNNLFEDRENMIVYTGTHDNETIKGWLEGQPRKVRLETERELNAWEYQGRFHGEKFYLLYVGQ